MMICGLCTASLRLLSVDTSNWPHSSPHSKYFTEIFVVSRAFSAWPELLVRCWFSLPEMIKLLIAFRLIVPIVRVPEKSIKYIPKWTFIFILVHHCLRQPLARSLAHIMHVDPWMRADAIPSNEPAAEKYTATDDDAQCHEYCMWPYVISASGPLIW